MTCSNSCRHTPTFADTIDAHGLENEGMGALDVKKIGRGSLMPWKILRWPNFCNSINKSFENNSLKGSVLYTPSPTSQLADLNKSWKSLKLLRFASCNNLSDFRWRLCWKIVEIYKIYSFKITRTKAKLWLEHSVRVQWW